MIWPLIKLLYLKSFIKFIINTFSNSAKRHPKGAMPTIQKGGFMTPAKTLINFYVPSDILQPFDRLCRLHGKPRSQVLNELLCDYILTMGQEAFSRIDQVRKIDERLKSALETSSDEVLGDLPPKAELEDNIGLRRKFSSF
jgi:hypothetical protein